MSEAGYERLSAVDAAFLSIEDDAAHIHVGGIILMDCGAAVHDYESDISRTWVFGEPSKKQRDVWNTVKRGQEMALETAVVVRDRVVEAYQEILRMPI